MAEVSRPRGVFSPVLTPFGADYAPDSAFQQFPMIAAMKEAIAAQSTDGAWRIVRPPLTELQAGQREALAQSQDAIGFVMPEAQLLAA